MTCCDKIQTIYTKKYHPQGTQVIYNHKWRIVSSCPLNLKKDVKSLKRPWDRAVKNNGEPEKDITKQNRITCLPSVCYKTKNEPENINCKFWRMFSKEMVGNS